MSELKNSKVFRIVISVLVALVIWLYVDNLDDTPRTLRVNNVPVTFIGEDTLMERSLLVTSDLDITVDLELSGERTVINNLERGKKDIRLQVDLRDITNVGSHTLEWEIFYPDSVNRNNVTITSASSYYVTVDVVELYSKSVPIRGQRVGSPAEGYMAGEMSFDQESITVSGEQLAVANISHALVTVDLTGATESFSTVCEFQLIDFNGDVVEDASFRTDVETVRVTVPILMMKELPLVVEFVESPGSTLDDIEYELSVDSITVSGDVRSISRLESVVLTEVDISELTGDTTITVPIPIPSGSTSVSGETEATITIKFKEGIATETFEVTNISLIHEPTDGRIVTVVSNTMEVTLRGPAEELAEISPYNIRVIGDLADVEAESGSYAVPATVYVDGAENVGAIGTYQVTVRIGDS